MPCVLALDEGTTSARAIVFDEAGAVRAVAQRAIEQHFPRPGWVEHDPEEIWATQMAVAAEALARARLGPRELAAVGITNQRETTVLWDRTTGMPLARAIVWQDRRTAAACDQLRAAGADWVIRAKTGLVLDAYFSGTKIAWLLDTLPGARAKAEVGQLAFGTIDSWLVWKLTNGKVHATDATNASRTLLYNIHERCWDDELLALLRVPRAILPQVRSCSEIYGEVSTVVGVMGVPLAGIAGDQQAALFGQMCRDAGMTKITYGTGCFMLQNTGTVPVESRRGLLTTIALQRGGRTTYALEGSVFIGGAVVQWLRDGLGLVQVSEEIEPLAASVPDNGGVYLVPAFAGLGAPHWDPYARGIIIGITRGTTAGHFARAGLESIAFQSADLLDAINADSGTTISELRVDGGAARDNLLMQFQADLLGVPVVRPAITETTALGAAYLAGLATGVWKSDDAITTQWKVERRFEPQMPRGDAAALRDRWNEAVQRAKGWEKGGVS